jgi:hypothetical protein
VPTSFQGPLLALGISKLFLQHDGGRLCIGRMAQAATRSLKDVIPKVLPPSSPFGELLRQSKFASFDPCIRQTYSAPPSYSQKGNFGLKRPISNRKSHAYIVLKDFEEHAQYIEWDNAKGQVKWLKKVEELYVAPQLKAISPWAFGLGPSATSKESGLDSDFCPGESALVERDISELNAEQETTEQEISAESSTLENLLNTPPSPAESPISAEALLPSRGKGGYGTDADIYPSEAGKMFLQPNISAMPPAVFKRYMEKLRKLRPEFIAYVRTELEKIWSINKKNDTIPDLNATSDEELIATLGPLILEHKFHLRFMGLKTEAEYHAEPVPETVSRKERIRLEQEALLSANKPQPIRPQPHKFAGLMYAHPTAIETRFISKAQPGIYLEHSPSQFSLGDKHIASFAGIASQFRHLGVGAKPVFESGTGANLDNLSEATRIMSPTNLTIVSVPTVVGRSAPSKPMLHLQMRTTVVDDVGVNKNQRDNPHTPGSYEYNSLMSSTSHTRLMTRIPDRAHSRSHPWGGSEQLGNKLYEYSSRDWNKTRGSGVFDPKASSPQFRRLNYDKVVEGTDSVTQKVGSMLERARRKVDTSEDKPSNRPE